MNYAVILVLAAAFSCTACDTGSDAPADTDADADSDGDADTDTDTDADSDGDADTDTDADADSDGDADTDTDADSDSDTGSETDSDSDTDTGIVAGLVWVSIPGGTFQMGSTSYAIEQPVHGVTVPTFEMTKTEVTVTQYAACVTDGSCTAPLTTGDCGPDASGNWTAAGHENDPINCVSWYQAVEFCAWVLGRLPSESEWEYAASNGTSENTYPWGDAAATCDLAVMEGPVSPGCDTERTWPVCSKTAGNTTHGLCDMSGNVFEWVQDTLHGAYDCDMYSGAYNCSAGGVAPDDGGAWEDDGGGVRVGRGGGFDDSIVFLRAASRGAGTPTDQSGSLGFRCTR